MSASDVLIRFEGGSIGYGRDVLLDRMDIAIHEGEFWGLIGPNGAGKSTLLKTLLGVIPPLKGRLIRRDDMVVGYVPQRSVIDPIYPFTALEVVRSGVMGRYPKRRLGFVRKNASVKQGIEAMERIGIEHVANKPFRDLSGGEQQRVLVSRALIREPNLLILDEPTAGMDLPSEKRLLDTISRLSQSQSLAVMLVVHQISLVVARAQHMAIINTKKRLFHAATADALLTDSRLTALYGRPMTVIQGTGGHPLVMAGDEDRGEL